MLRAGIPLARRRDRDEREPHIRYPRVEPWMRMESATMINGFGPTFLGDRSTTDNNYAYTNDAALLLDSIQHGLTETGCLFRLELMTENLLCRAADCWCNSGRNRLTARF